MFHRVFHLDHPLSLLLYLLTFPPLLHLQPLPALLQRESLQLSLQDQVLFQPMSLELFLIGALL